MELEEMQNLWTEMSQKMGKQQSLTDKIITDMIQQKYRNRFDKISTYETIGAVVCFIAAILMIVNFGKLDTWYFVLSGGFSIAYLLVLPVIVLNSLNKIKRLNIAQNTYKQTILAFAKAKKQLLQVQKTGIYLNVIFVAVFMPVVGKLFHDKDVFLESNLVYIYIPLMMVFLFFFSKWGYSCYTNITSSAEKVLQELEGNK
ncbi:hypothetical protein [Chondrinema litorale]|uniref:hypothetical protein n=1 Tax=Chondrinema litorale TaxID=2994555 RepID=UPI002543542C|nr:hypothetical protein [Chondrinema litorale]UZR95214.1 hypothetical protein OQ292_05200 [Chondrinema litorale]